MFPKYNLHQGSKKCSLNFRDIFFFLKNDIFFRDVTLQCSQDYPASNKAWVRPELAYCHSLRSFDFTFNSSIYPRPLSSFQNQNDHIVQHGSARTVLYSSHLLRDRTTTAASCFDHADSGSFQTLAIHELRCNVESNLQKTSVPRSHD